MSTITVNTCNIRTDNPVPSAAAKERMQLAAAQGGVVFGQEIDNPAYDKLWDATMKAAGKVTYGQKSECPISLPTADWSAIRARIDNVHGGLEGISPHRDISVSHATHTKSARLSFLDCHTVSKPRKGVDEAAWRIEHWNEYIDALKKLVRAEHALGLTVVFGGDLNQTLTKIPTIHPDAVLLASSGLDHLWVLPASGWKVKVAKPVVLARTEEMDHPILTASFDLAKAEVVATPPATATPKPPAESTVARITKIAKSYVGYHEGRTGSTWNNDNRFAKAAGFANFQAWCATFLVAIFKEAGVGALLPVQSPGVDQLVDGFRKIGRTSEYPAVGALMARGKPSDLTHIGFVYAYDDTYAYTIEGNTNTNGSAQGDGVYQLRRTRRDAKLVLYCYPDYPEGIDSADPKWARKPAKPPVGTPPKPSTTPALVIDYSFAEITPARIAAMKKADTVGVMRYISYGSDKDVTQAEVKLLHAAGFWLGLIFESTANRAGQGEAAGKADVARAEAEADRLGYPKDAVLFYAVDFDADPEKVQPYFHGIKAGARRPAGIYGSFRVVTAGFVPWRWQATAWSHGMRASSAHLFQKVGGAIAGTDENDLLHEFPVWKAAS